MWNINGGSEKNYLIRHFYYVQHIEQFVFPSAYVLNLICGCLKKKIKYNYMSSSHSKRRKVKCSKYGGDET